MTTASARTERALLILLALCTVAALAGYATFGLHPQWIGANVSGMRAYAAAITGFPRAHILLGFATLAVVLLRWAGARWLPAAIALYAVSLGSELLGTSTGLPFGAYHYTDGLGVKWLGRVPMLIPLSWCTMSLAAIVITRQRLGGRGRLTTILLGSLLLVAWDLALDPAMSRLTPYWVWGSSGPYFGMPLLNVAGWYLTGAVLMGIMLLLRADRWIDALSPSATNASLLVYGANLALPVGMTIAAGLPGAALVAVIVLALACGGSVVRQFRMGHRVERDVSRAEVAR
jgi:putative membrane protein